MSEAGAVVKMLVLAIGAALPSLSSAEASSGGDVRGLDWGTPIQTVKAQERATLVFASEDILKYETELVGRRMSLLYMFSDRRLESVSYHYDPYHQCGGQFAEKATRISCELRAVLGAFEEIKGLIGEKHGPPVPGDPNQHCFDDESTMSRSIIQDDLNTPMCYWVSGRTAISLSVSRAVQKPSDGYLPFASLQVSFDGNSPDAAQYNPAKEKDGL